MTRSPLASLAVRSSSHNCLDGNAGCVETFVIEAPYDDALQCIGTVRGADESVSVEYTVVPVDIMNAQTNERQVRNHLRRWKLTPLSIKTQRHSTL